MNHCNVIIGLQISNQIFLSTIIGFGNKVTVASPYRLFNLESNTKKISKIWLL